MRPLLLAVSLVSLAAPLCAQPSPALSGAAARRADARAPYWPEPGVRWAHRAPSAVGIDSVQLAAAIAFAIANESKLPRDLERAHYQTFGREPFGAAAGPFRTRGQPSGVVVRHGYIVAEW